MYKANEYYFYQWVYDEINDYFLEFIESKEWIDIDPKTFPWDLYDNNVEFRRFLLDTYMDILRDHMDSFIGDKSALSQYMQDFNKFFNK